MSNLTAYIQAQPNRTMKEWAKDLGVSRAFLYALMDGSRQPSLIVAQRIDAATEGKVPITTWPNIRAVVDAAHCNSPSSDTSLSEVS